MRSAEFEEHLMKNIVPFWNKLMDIENGGFFGYVDGNVCIDKKADKGVILCNRILWFYSNISMAGFPSLLKYADHAFNFLKDKCYDREYGGVYWSLSYDGVPRDVIKHTYNQAFAIYSLASYYQACDRKNEEAISLALTLFDLIEVKCKDEGGYLEAFERDFTPASNEKLSENGVMASRTMNTLLHVLEAYTELYKATDSEKVKTALLQVLKLFKEKIFDDKLGICKVFFDYDYNSLIDLESYGHNIEASWLLDRCLETINDDSLRCEYESVSEKLAKTVYKNAYEFQNGLNNEREDNIIRRNKIWWVQAEAVIGFYNLYQKTKEEKYAKAAEDIWDYIKTHMIHEASGEWIEEVSEDGTIRPNQALVHPWKCPYHNGRMCLEMIRRLYNEG